MPSEATRAAIEAEQRAMEAERQSVESKAAGAKALKEQARTRTAETLSRIDRGINSDNGE